MVFLLSFLPAESFYVTLIFISWSSGVADPFSKLLHLVAVSLNTVLIFSQVSSNLVKRKEEKEYWLATYYVFGSVLGCVT